MIAAAPPTGDVRAHPRAAASRREARHVIRLTGIALALGGWVFGIALCAFLLTQDGAVLRGDLAAGYEIGDPLPEFVVGVDLAAYLRAGDDLVAGRPVYEGSIGTYGAFSYAPPWAVLFGALAWVPDVAMLALMVTLGLLALRYVAGSWLWVGLAFWYPVTVMVMLAGNIELLIAAALVLAARGHAGPLAFTALAKVAPGLGIPPRGWREAAVVLAVALLVTLPWLHLWPEWVDYVLRQPTAIDISIGPPWFWRLPVALLLLALRRPWASALAVIVAMPSLWLGTLVILVAVVRLWLDGRRVGPGRDLAPATEAAPA